MYKVMIYKEKYWGIVYKNKLINQIFLQRFIPHSSMLIAKYRGTEDWYCLYFNTPTQAKRFIDEVIDPCILGLKLTGEKYEFN